MNIRDFINQYRNHPVLFIGTGVSLRYLDNSFTWDGLLKFISLELKGNNEFYLDIKSECQINDKYDFTLIATKLEKEFNDCLAKDRNGKFKEINDLFYKEMEKENNLSRFKIYISKLIGNKVYKEDKKEELSELKKIRKNIGSIITTNYDNLIEDVFGFEALVGNDILLSNPYGSVYKIHGCYSDPAKIIITNKDYEYFDNKYEFVRAQLLSIFIHNPIIFLGYGIGDENIKSLLKTIFTYVEPNSDDAKRIRDNFLLVEYEADSQSHEITEHDIDLEGFSTIRINKVKTDDFVEVYKSISDLNLPVSAMDIRKVQSIVKDIYSGKNEDGSSVKVNITEDIESLNNNDKILVIGSAKSIKYEHKNSSSFMTDYFEILEESNKQLIQIIDNIHIADTQWFPAYAFTKICPELRKGQVLREQQKQKLENLIQKQATAHEHQDIKSLFDDDRISHSGKYSSAILSVMHGTFSLKDVEIFLKTIPSQSRELTDYRRLLCAFDYKKETKP